MFFVQHQTVPSAAHSVQDLMAEYREAKRKANCRPWHLRTIEYRIGKFAQVFAGVRPTELQRLTWESVNFDLRYIHIAGGVSKVRNERYVDMEEVLVKWLEPYRQASGPTVVQDAYSFTRIFNLVREQSGLKDTWTPDVIRHAYASYHVARYERKDKTALMMGHSVKMLDRHYRRPLHRSDTTEFWNIFPPQPGQ